MNNIGGNRARRRGPTNKKVEKCDNKQNTDHTLSLPVEVSKVNTLAKK